MGTLVWLEKSDNREEREKEKILAAKWDQAEGGHPGTGEKRVWG